jgi:hypothetical protein
MNPLRLTREEVEALEEHPLGWRLIEDEETGRLRIVDGDGDDIIYVGDNRRWEAQAPELIAAAPDLRADLLMLHAEVERLRAELAKPVAGAWVGCIRSVGGYSVAFSLPADAVPGDDECGWWAQHPDGTLIASGPETGNAGRRACDLALAATYRLVGGVFGGEP